MNLTTIKEYAELKNISYEAVRKQIKRYSDDLEGHITRQNGTQYLDDWAVDFLSEKRRQSPIVVINEDQGEEIKALQQEVESLRNRLEQMKADNLALKEKDISTQYELIEAKKRMLLLEAREEERQETVQRLKDTEAELMMERAQHAADQERLEEVKQQRDTAQAEANSYERSIFGFYRKRKG